jgi:NAD-dependent SIR2 family protein deacetylase
MADLETLIRFLKNSKKVLFLTGAGMSADSGIPTFRDKEGFLNNFPVYKNKNLNPKDLANGMKMLNDPEESWGFYEWRRRNSKKNSPHKGYFIINDLLNLFEDSFVKTTNTDGYHLRSGIPEDKIYEVHGSMWKLQFLKGEDNFTIGNFDVPLCDLDEKTMLVDKESIPKYNNSLLRPNILMFNDPFYVPNSKQLKKFYDFAQEKIDTVFLIGSDISISTNVLTAKRFQKSFDSKIICINPNPSCCGNILIPDLYINSNAKNALEEIYEVIKR